MQNEGDIEGATFVYTCESDVQQIKQIIKFMPDKRMFCTVANQSEKFVMLCKLCITIHFFRN